MAVVGAGALMDLEGRWENVYQEQDGEPQDAPLTVVELSGTEFKIEKDGDVAYQGRFTVGPAKGNESRLEADGPEQYEIVLFYDRTANPLFSGGPRPGLFQIQGDTLKWVFSAVGHSSPRSFNTYRGSEKVYSVYRREGTARLLPAGQPTLLRSSACW